MKKRIWLLLLTLAVVAAACGDGTGSSTTAAAGDGSTTAAPVTGGETINLVANAWTASALNAEIAKQLIESELGNPVEIVAIDENTMFTGLSDGSLDVVLEVWPSGITPDEQAFLDDGSVVNVGELGVVGQIGWFVPSYVIDEHPDLATWEGYLDPANAALFATAETGDLGRFLGTDPSYSQYDEPIIANLGLPFMAVFSGSEPATVAELDTRVAASEPILMYWWTPTAAVAKYDLVQVELPEYSDECYGGEVSEVDCAYPSDTLVKLASAGLEEKAPNVLTFLEAFTLTNEDQLGMLPAVEIDGEDASDIAAQWIADNEDVWSAWLAAQ